MTMPTCRIRVASVVALVALGACARDAATVASKTPEILGTRTVTNTQWDTTWTRGGTDADTVVLFPFAITAHGDRVYVLDAAAKRVVALRASDGSLVWSAGREGRGPSEFREPTAIAVTPTGEIAVADAANARIALLSRTGEFLDHIPLRQVGYVQSMCALGDASLLLSTLELERPVLRLARSGAVTARYDLPWSDADRIPPLARQAVLEPTSDHTGCIMALTFGRGFARFDGKQFQSPHPYIESFDLPEVDVSESERSGKQVRREKMLQRRIAAHDVDVHGNVLAVAFEGTTRDAGRLIDFYDLRTGSYLRSHVLPWASVSLTRAGSSYILLGAGGGGVLAVAPRQPRRHARR